MVHRPSDSRLLTNLLSHEKDYTKSLHSLLDHSNASLASFSAYASASSPPVSLALIAVAGSLAGADEALRRYTRSVEEWQVGLKELKGLEDEVGNIMRDREILVTRLIKASKSQKPTRDSLLTYNPATASSSTSLKSEFSSSMSHTNITPQFTTHSKLNNAQAELQACEAHLAIKERELDNLRASMVKEGLSMRCKAMVECGWAWGEMGKEGLRALEGIGEANRHARTSTDHHTPPTPSPSQFKPLPNPASSTDHSSNPHRPSSDLSSLAPSQSASQINLNIPPAHAISELTLPHAASFTADVGTGMSSRIKLDRRITEESEQAEEEGSSAEEDGNDVQVVENERFATNTNRFSIRGAGTKSDIGPRVEDSGGRDRKASVSHGFFGSIRGLFKSSGGGNGSKESVHEKLPNGHTTGLFGGGEKKWTTRTDKNLKAAKKGGDDSSDDEDIGGRGGVVSDIGASSSPRRARVATRGGTKRLQKGKSASPQKPVASRAEEWVNGQSQIDARLSIGPVPSGDPESTPKAKKTASGKTKSKPKSITVLDDTSKPLSPPLSTSGLGRNTSIVSSSSAPAGTSKRRASVSTSTPGKANSTPTRSSSVNYGKSKANGIDHRPTLTNGEASLMSIVEGVSRQNREGRHGNSSLAIPLPKAPPPVKRHTLDGTPSSPSPLRTMELPRAPGSVFPEDNHSDSPLPVSHSPVTPSFPQSSTLTAPNSTTRPAKSPLRSALRTSRSPSPTPSPTAAIVPPLPTQQQHQRGRSPSLVRAVSPKTHMNGSAIPMQQSPSDDRASLSSYETGHEVFEDTGDETEKEDNLPPPPPPTNHAVSDLSGSSNASTEVQPGAAPARRKSVRVSLQPTFSPAPPALEDEDDEEGHAPWSGKKKEEGQAIDMWEDSSEEDEEYRRAKRLLSRAERKAKGNKKGKQRGG